MSEFVMVVLIVAIMAVMAARSFYRIMTGKDSGCVNCHCCFCKDCAKADPEQGIDE